MGRDKVTLRRLLVESRIDGPFLLRALSQAEACKDTDLLAALPEQHLVISGVTVIEHAFQTRYVQTTCNGFTTHVPPLWAWHGAPLDKIERILTHGFAVPPSPSNGRAIGHGVYLAESPAMDLSQYCTKPAEDGHRHLLLCQIYAQRLEEIPETLSVQKLFALSGRFHGEHPESEGAKLNGICVIW